MLILIKSQTNDKIKIGDENDSEKMIEDFEVDNEDKNINIKDNKTNKRKLID